MNQDIELIQKFLNENKTNLPFVLQKMSFSDQLTSPLIRLNSENGNTTVLSRLHKSTSSIYFHLKYEKK